MEPTTFDLNQTLLIIGGHAITMAQALLAGAIVSALGVLLVAWKRARTQQRLLAKAQQQSAQTQAQMQQLLGVQVQLQGRMQAMADVLGRNQTEMGKSLNARLDAMTGRLGQSMQEQTRATHDNLARLGERLAVIDKAQTNIQSLAGQVVELQSILSNKQTRGVFGQNRMEAIVADGLPMGSYDFQPTLSNNMRPDCLIAMPNEAPKLVIDAKFPLESWNAIRNAEDEAGLKRSTQMFRRDMDVHVKAIAEKYLLPGETQDTAFLFVPSESIFADIHEHHEPVITAAHKARVVIVSPSLLMLSVQVVQALLKDVRMREQAHLIQAEVAMLMADLGRLDTRVGKLAAHFAQAQKDIDEITTSSRKLTSRGRRIEEMEFEHSGSAAQVPAVLEGGKLRLRVVEDD